MAKLVELTLSLSSKLPDTLMLVILSDPLTGEIFKIGVAERIMIDFSMRSYDDVEKTGFACIENHTYARYITVVGNYLYAYYQASEHSVIDSYNARINWVVDNNIQIGAYPNSIIHKQFNQKDLVSNLRSYYPCQDGALWLYSGGSYSYATVIDDKFNVAHIYYDTENLSSRGTTCFDFVASEQGINLVLAKDKPFKDQGIFLYNETLNSNPFANGQEIRNYPYQKISNELLYYYNEQKDTVHPKIEFLIKQNIPGYIANIKNTGNIILPISAKECYKLKNGNNPTGWDRMFSYVAEQTETSINRPNLKVMYPALELIGSPDYLGRYSHILSSYLVYYDVPQGFWKDHLYTEEINSA